MMHAILRIVYGPGVAFVEHAERAFLIAIGFGILFAVSILRSGKSQRGTQMGILFTTFLWVIFGLNEQQIQGRGANIRVDLLFSWPPLFAVSLATAWFAIRDIVTRKPSVQNADTPREDPSLRANPHG